MSLITQGWTSTNGIQYKTISVSGVTQVLAVTTFVGLQNLSGSAQTVTVTVYDGPNTSGNALTPPVTLAAGAIYQLPLGGMQLQSGTSQVTVSISGAPLVGINVLYQ